MNKWCLSHSNDTQLPCPAVPYRHPASPGWNHHITVERNKERSVHLSHRQQTCVLAHHHKGLKTCQGMECKLCKLEYRVAETPIPQIVRFQCLLLAENSVKQVREMRESYLVIGGSSMSIMQSGAAIQHILIFIFPNRNRLSRVLRNLHTHDWESQDRVENFSLMSKKDF